MAQCHAPCAGEEVVIETKDLQSQDVRQNFCKFAAYSKTFITHISAVSCALRDQAHHLEVKP
jgi:hypothetical protein